MDIFRIFDCFNDVSNMEVAIAAVRKANKVAEVRLGHWSHPETRDPTLRDALLNTDY